MGVDFFISSTEKLKSVRICGFCDEKAFDTRVSAFVAGQKDPDFVLKVTNKSFPY
jgi:hypothetical protein